MNFPLLIFPSLRIHVIIRETGYMDCNISWILIGYFNIKPEFSRFFNFVRFENCIFPKRKHAL